MSPRQPLVTPPPPAPPSHEAAAISTVGVAESAGGAAAYAANLSKKIWRTRGARLNAYRRLTQANEWSLRALSFLSAYAIFATLALTVPTFGLSSAQKDGVGVALNSLSVFILVVSLLEAPRNYQVRADRLHRCAVELGELQNELELQIAIASPSRLAEVLPDYNDQYAAALARCPENHEPLDDAVFCAQHPKDFRLSPWGRFRTRHLDAYQPFMLYYVLVWLPPLVAAAVGFRSWR